MADLSRNETALSSGETAPWLTIVGLGEDGRAGLSAAALKALDEAELVVGGIRHLALVAPLARETLAWPSSIQEAFPAILARRGGRVCVLASGDPFHYGVGVQLTAHVPAAEMRVLPQPSAFSLAAGRLGWAQQDCALVSLHGRPLERIVPYLQPGARILALSWDGSTPAKLAALLGERGLGASEIVVLEALGGPRERVRRGIARDFVLDDIDPLNTIGIDVVAGPGARTLPLTPGLDDDWFSSDGQLTKAEIRAVTLSALSPRRGQVLWDIGAGSGSIAIEWCLRHQANRAFAIEPRPDRAARIEANALDLGAPEVTLVRGEAPAALAGLAAPDAVFIGGGIGDAGVFETAWAGLKSGGLLVANVVTLEGEARLAALFATHGGTMRRIAVARLDAIGGLHGWRAAMPVTQWRVQKP
ncbi:precorrin-6y C5,15-methyltransferase (decarboxylating) subunit CbiE [Phreatobacter stygius]|uniref:Precorrin-6y C5,15-methyltransferase (Decarboxylating) subunit CbiE n=1 Tax=Phreatobacter stygius TaxID=1940610 RepID=A0A4D7BKL4_9HYPH|nr:precorrin-6y C5,15-methyltransferase (decarboxylating) subunit CbiE [Phreatobacter stygius]QCI68287.1 precorrin-6y C5,15-methyltransferase (decarboxylating) subunit CbiE [Phreatobacter stygius]